jgi:hypothetical protein
MIRRPVLCVTLLLVLTGSRSAFADATAFVGLHVNPERQAFRGLAVGAGLVVIGFEGEYAQAGEDTSAGLPSLLTVSGNVYAQTPIPIKGMRFYATTGVGAYREQLESLDHQETNVVFNTGGGAKITLIGPLRLRLDYRVLKLRGGTVRPSAVHRIYAGLNLGF